MIRKIHQVWVQGQDHFAKTHPEMASWSAKWRDLYPDFEHRLWSEEEYLPLVKSYSIALAHAYDRAPCFAAKSDIARVVILLHHGGIYADTDYEPLRRCDWLIDAHVQLGLVTMALPSAKVLLANFHPDFPCNNAWIYARDHSQYLTSVLDRIASLPYESGSKEHYTWNVTGPRGWAEVMVSVNVWNQKDVRILPSTMMEIADFAHLEPTFMPLTALNKSYPYAVGIHRCNGSWQELGNGAVQSSFGRFYAAINEWEDFVLIICFASLIAAFIVACVYVVKYNRLRRHVNQRLTRTISG